MIFWVPDTTYSLLVHLNPLNLHSQSSGFQQKLSMPLSSMLSATCHYALAHPSIPCSFFPPFQMPWTHPFIVSHSVCKRFSIGTYLLLLNFCQWLLPFMKCWIMNQSFAIRCPQVSYVWLHSIHRDEHKVKHMPLPCPSLVTSLYKAEEKGPHGDGK